jgi:hypothetical protein
MNEMSERERFEFEEKLHSDPNLIIEFELMRKTLGKLKQTPVLKTPDYLRASILKKATTAARVNKTKSIVFAPAFRYAAAVAVVSGAFLMGSVMQDPTTGSSALKSLSGSSKNAIAPKTASSNGWVDKQDVIEIKDYNIGSLQKPDSLALKNAKKLRLIEKPLIEVESTDQLLLTRTTKKP